MSGRIVAEASVALPLLGKGLDMDALIARPELATVIRSAIGAFVQAIDRAVMGAVNSV
jgi:hypothetical protein